MAWLATVRDDLALLGNEYAPEFLLALLVVGLTFAIRKRLTGGRRSTS